MSCLSKGERESSCGLFCALGLDLSLEVDGDGEGDGDGDGVDVNVGVVVGANGNVCDGASMSRGNSSGTGCKTHCLHRHPPLLFLHLSAPDCHL